METFKLPVGNFRWVDEKELKKWTAKDILRLPSQDETGYAFECDLVYPKKYHKRDDQFPLAPYNDTLSFKHLSRFNRRLLKKHNLRDYKQKRYSSKKLLATFYKRKKYVVLLDNLKYYLQRGMKLVKVRRAVKFEQKDFLKNFITKITQMRSTAKNDFELRLFKLFANSTFGKFIENARNYMEILLCHDEKTLRKHCLGQHISNFKIINENLVAIMKKPSVIELKKPLAVGFAILELSKLFMYKAYVKFKRYFGSKNLRLCFSDTDSFLFQVKCSNLIDKLDSMKHMFDFSKYDKAHPLYDNSRANHLFYFKDEMKGQASITKFIGLRPKCYGLKIKNLKNNSMQEKKICKGLKRTSIKNHLTFDDYENCLNNTCQIYKSFNHLKSKNHQIFTSFQRKIALSAMDTKRYILSCGKCTRALGNVHIEEDENNHKCTM